MTTQVRLYDFGDRDAELVLFCFPHAGGAAPFFRPWAASLPVGVTLSAFQLPGRQDLMGAPPFPDLASLVKAASSAVLERAAGRAFAFFGHSMGAVTAFETARRLRREGRPGPRTLGVSGCAAPQLRAGPRLSHPLDDGQLLAHVAALGGLDEQILRSPELLALTMPAVRADFELLLGYRYVPQPPLDCRLVAFGGVADPSTPAASLQAWQEHSTRPVQVERYPGGHFFLTRQAAAIVGALCAEDSPDSSRMPGLV
jgi:medium-chain acyl-[acyl-carrier-protein] hydrolase